MPKFNLRVKDRAGKVVNMVRVARDEKEVTKALREQGYSVVEVRREQGGVRKEKSQDILAYVPFLGKKPMLPASLIAQFSRQLGVMIRAGMPLIDALEAIRDESEDERLHNALSAVVSDVEAGSRLSEAMQR